MNYTLMSKSAIQYLCKCINLTANVSDIINDIQLTSNQTMSSVKVDKLIKQCLQDANDYSDQVVSALTHLVAEKIDFEPTLDNTADKLNTLLLYSKNSDNNYTQYLRLTNELLNLGDTSLSLDEYLKISDADKFVLKTSYDDLVTKVNEIDNTIGTETLTTTSQTITGAVNDLVASVDGKIDKDKIVTVLDNTVTDEQVPSAKAVVDSISSISSVSNLTSLVPVTNLNDFKGSSFMIGRGTGYNNETTNIPNGVNGAFVVEWFPYGNGDLYGVQKITLVQPINNKYVTFERSLDNNNWMGWQRVCSTTVEDIGVTNVTLPTNLTYASDTSVRYQVVNGICYIDIYFRMVATTIPIGSPVEISGFPKPKSQANFSCNGEIKGGIMMGLVRVNGMMRLYRLTNDAPDNYSISFSYPVAE